MDRRHFLGTGMGAAWSVTGCQPAAHANAHIQGGFTGVQPERGHWLRDGVQGGKGWPTPTRTLKTRVLIRAVVCPVWQPRAPFVSRA